MATPKNAKSYRYGGKKRICFKPKKGPRVCFTGRERVPTGAGGPEHGGTACRTAGGKFKRCAGGPWRPARQEVLFGRGTGRRIWREPNDPGEPKGLDEVVVWYRANAAWTVDPAELARSLRWPVKRVQKALVSLREQGFIR